MTTQVDTMQDILRILRDEPELLAQLRALLLTEELLALPAKVAELTVELREFVAEQRELNREQQEFNREQRELNRKQEERNARLDQTIVELTSELREFIAEQRERNAHFDQTIAELQQFNREQRELNREQKQLNTAIIARLDRLEADMSEAKADIRELKTDMTDVKSTLSTIQGHVGNLIGEKAERRVCANIGNLLHQHSGLDLGLITVLKSNSGPTDPATELRLADARRAQRISREEYQDLHLSDLIVQADDLTDGAELYLAVEVSRTLNQYDISRIERRARLLGQAMNAPARGVVVAAEIPVPQQRQAAAAGVIALHYAQL